MMEINENETPYNNECMTYFFVARQSSDNPDTSGDYAALVSNTNDAWVVSTQKRNANVTILTNIETYPSSYFQFGSGFLEFKVRLTDMGQLNGTFPRAYTHAIGSH